MNAADRSQLLQALHTRRDTIAGSWFKAVAPTSFVPLSATEVRQRFIELTEQAIALLLAEPFERRRWPRPGAVRTAPGRGHRRRSNGSASRSAIACSVSSMNRWRTSVALRGTKLVGATALNQLPAIVSRRVCRACRSCDRSAAFIA